MRGGGSGHCGRALLYDDSMTASMPLTIAILGAGTAGLAAAAFLALDGHRVTIHERFAQPHPVGAGLMLQPTGLAVLAALGLDRHAIAASSVIRRLDGRAGTAGRRIFDNRYADLAPHLFGLGIHRGTLFSLLYGAVQAAGVPVRTGITAVALDYGEGGRPSLVDATGARHGPFDLVVDASGARSALRPPHKARPYPYGALWAILRDTEQRFDPHALTQRYYRARHMMGVLPVGPPNVAYFWSLPAATYPAVVEGGIEAWRRQAIGLWPETGSLLGQIEDFAQLTFASYSHVTLRRPHGERLAFIGDAAHTASPQLGQGANLALIDAFTLAASLRIASGVEAALWDYAAARRSHIRFYQTASRWLTPFFQSDSRIMPLLRDATFGALCHAPYMRTEMLRTLGGVKTGLFSHLDPGQWDTTYALHKRASKAAIE